MWYESWWHYFNYVLNNPWCMMMFQSIICGCNSGVNSMSIVKKVISSKFLLRVEFSQFLCSCNQEFSAKLSSFYKKSIFHDNASLSIGSNNKHFLIKPVTLRLVSNQESKWENLLLSEKKNNIKDIPVKVRKLYSVFTSLKFTCRRSSVKEQFLS